MTVKVRTAIQSHLYDARIEVSSIVRNAHILLAQELIHHYPNTNVEIEEEKLDEMWFKVFRTSEGVEMLEGK